MGYLSLPKTSIYLVLVFIQVNSLETTSQSESNGRITDRGVLSMCLGPIDANDSGKILNLCLANTDVTDDCLSKLAAAFPFCLL